MYGGGYGTNRGDGFGKDRLNPDYAKSLAAVSRAIERIERSIARSFDRSNQQYDLPTVSSRIQTFPSSVVLAIPPATTQLIGADPRRWFIAFYTTDTLGANIGFSNNPPFNGIFIDRDHPFVLKYSDWGPYVGGEFWATAVAAPLTVEIYPVILLQPRA